MREIAAQICSLIDQGRRGALATVVRASGSTPQVIGAKLVLADDGTTVGTIGGGRIEQVVLEAMRETLATGRAQIVKKHLSKDLGMCCGGEMEIFVEPVEARPSLLLFGAGHVAKPVAELAHRAGFAVFVVDARDELNDATRFPEAVRIVDEPDEVIRRGAVPFGPNAFVVVCTHDHRLDEQTLVACLRQPRRYLGMIGSKRKVLLTFERIRARHPELAATLAHVHAPIGLDLGAVTPDEIALAIVAELVATRRGAVGHTRSLKAGETHPVEPSPHSAEVATPRERRG